MSRSPDPDFDIAIVGAGMVGMALAIALDRSSSLRIALLDGGPKPPPLKQTQPDSRVVALTEASRQFLHDLEVWPLMNPEHICPYTKMEVWDGTGTGRIQFNCDEIGENNLGHIVENAVITDALFKKLASTQVNTLWSARVEAFAVQEPYSHLTLDNGDVIRSSLVVAADGGQSTVRRLSNLPIREWSYNHTALTCVAKTSQSHEYTARQCFTAHGPLAFLPLLLENRDTHHCAVVWSVTPNDADTLVACTDASFATKLETAFERALGDIERVYSRHAFPLTQRHCKRYFKSGVVVIGDAAHTLHPLAGQGANLGFKDAAALAEEIKRAIDRKMPLQDITILERYQRRRMGDNLAMMAAMEGFKRLFARDELPLRWLRNQGLNIVDRTGYLKRRIIREAMGL